MYVSGGRYRYGQYIRGCICLCCFWLDVRSAKKLCCNRHILAILRCLFSSGSIRRRREPFHSVQEAQHVLRDLLDMCLEQEVPSIQQFNLTRDRLLSYSLRTSRHEYRVVLAPYRQHRDLALPHPALKFGVQGDIRLIVPEQVELYLSLVKR